MLERPGDVSIEERVNSGECELSHFMPAHSEEDMVTNMHKSAMKMWIWHDGRVRKQHQSTRRDLIYAGSVDLPDYVISQIIRIGDRRWNYQTEAMGSALRRVFIEKDQTIKLDMGTTLSYLNASEGTPRYEETFGLLTGEASDINNQVIMQLMYERVQAGQSLLPLCSKKLIKF